MTAGLAWLAHAIARRPVKVRFADPGELTFGNGELIQVAGGNAPGDERFALLAHAALIRRDSLAPDILETLRGRPVQARRFVFLETLRAGGDLEFVLPQWFHDALTAWEDVPRSATAAHSLDRACSPERLPAPPDVLGTLVGRRAGVGTHRPDDAVSSGPRDRDAEQDPDEETERSRILRLLSAPLPANPFLNLFRSRRGVRGGAKGGEGGANLPDGEEIPAVATGATEYVVRAASRRVKGPAPLVLRSHVYPEWDAGRGTYRPGWCRLFEVAPRRSEAAFAGPAPSAEIEYRLRRLALGLDRHGGAASGDELDLDRLVERRIQRRAGTKDDHSRVYIDRVRRRPELSLAVVLDASGSTQERRGPRSVLEEEKRLCALLLDAGQAADLRTAAFGFCSNGRESVYFLRVKRFDDRYGLAARRRLQGVEPTGFTRIGAAIRHASATVPTTSGTPRNVLLLLTDGFPYDDGYQDDYAAEDTARALGEARLAGLACACLAIGSDQKAEQLARVFDGAAAHAATADTLGLIVDLIQRAIGAAATY